MLRERLRKILDKPATRDLIEDLAEVIEELVAKYNPLYVILAGSLARGEFVRGLSDIDILVVTDSRPSKLDRFMLRAVKDVNVEITVVSLEELRYALETGNQFMREAWERGLRVYERNVLQKQGGVVGGT